MDIKLGKFSLEDLMKTTEELKYRTTIAYSMCQLPDLPDAEYINKYLVKTMLEHFQK